MGTMQFGWTVTDVDAMRILDAYRDAGGNLVDTANMYGGDQSIEAFGPNSAHVGVSEDTVGRWLSSRGCRESMVVTTKVRARMWPGDDGEGLNRRHITRAVEDSLRRLRTDHVDVLYAHWPDPRADAQEWLTVFAELIAAGKVRWAGSSNFCSFDGEGDLLTPLLDLADRNASMARIAVEQPRLNLLNRSEFEEHLQAIAVREPLGIVSYSSLASGFLAGAVHQNQAPQGPRAGFLAQYCTPAGWRLLEAVEQIATSHEVPVASVALAWTLSQPGVTATIVGPETLQQLSDASFAPDVNLTTEELAILDERSWQTSDPEFVAW